MKKEYRKINDEIVNDTLKMYMGAPVEDYSADRLRDFVDSTRIFVKRNRFNPIVEDVNVVKYFTDYGSGQQPTPIGKHGPK